MLSAGDRGGIIWKGARRLSPCDTAGDEIGLRLSLGILDRSLLPRSSMLKGGNLQQSPAALAVFLHDQKIVPRPVDVSGALDASVITDVLHAEQAK
jgi:hypothetical protein